MIRCIVAIDEKRGLADDKGIPWDLPTDRRYFREKTEHGVVFMGYNTYLTLHGPLSDRRNIVVNQRQVPVRDGFEIVTDPIEFLKNTTEDIWHIGGAGLLKDTLQFCDELYITHVEGDFHCTKFLPAYEQDFELAWQSEPLVENNTRFTFAIYKRK